MAPVRSDDAGGAPAPPAIPLVAIGPYRPQTGFTRVLWSMLTRLGAGYDCHLVGMGYQGPRFRADGVTVHPTNLRGGDVFGAYQGATLAREIGARAVLCLNDLWMLKNYLPAFAALCDAAAADPRLPRAPKLVMYAPLDGRLPDDALMAPFTPVDAIVSYTAFGRTEMSRAMASVTARTGRAFACGAVRVVPHGVDTGTFHPLARTLDRQLAPGGRLDARRQAFPDRPDLHGAFLVLNANRPMPRKRVDLTIEGFARFVRHGAPRARMVLHHAIMSADERAQILAWADTAGIADRLVLSSVSAEEAAGREGTSDARLNLLYNACDVGVNTAMGEGWGLVTSEHAATGAAQIVPRHSACEELWAGAALLLEPVRRYVPSFALLEMAEIAPASLADALATLYGDPGRLRELSRAAHERATQPAWHWSAIAVQWDALLRDVIAAR